MWVDGARGSQKRNTRSGWGVVLMIGEHVVLRACGSPGGLVTTNAIELEALTQGLGFLLRQSLPTHVSVYTDSSYAMDAYCKLARYGSDGSLEEGSKLANRERILFLYELLYEFGLAGRCSLHKVEGHKGIFGNELADELSHRAAEGEEFIDETSYKL